MGGEQRWRKGKNGIPRGRGEKRRAGWERRPGGRRVKPVNVKNWGSAGARWGWPVGRWGWVGFCDFLLLFLDYFYIFMTSVSYFLGPKINYFSI